MTHICVSKLTIIGSNNGLSPDRRLAIIWTNDGMLLIGPLRNKLQWNLNRNSNIFIQENAFESVVCKTVAILSRPQCVKGSKYKMAAKFGQQNHFCYQINWCAILISSLNLTKQGILTLRLFITNYMSTAKSLAAKDHLLRWLQKMAKSKYCVFSKLSF